MFLILIFIVILPTQRRAKQQNMLVSSLKPGDEVITSSGIIAKVRSVADKFVSLEISQNAVIKVLKSHIQTTTKELEKTDEPKKK